jgi:site-specific recombinase XerD
MLDAPATVNHRNFLVIQVLWRTGVRVSELVSIRPRDIGWANQDSFAAPCPVRNGSETRPTAFGP